jgi:hypothetical protein
MDFEGSTIRVQLVPKHDIVAPRIDADINTETISLEC